MSDTSVELEKANWLMKWLKIPLTIRHLNELSPSVWIILYESLFQEALIDDLTLTPPQNNKNHLNRILSHLGKDIIQMDLSHISAINLMNGDLKAINMFLDLLYELARVLLVERSEKLQTTWEQNRATSTYRGQIIDAGRSVRLPITSDRRPVSTFRTSRTATAKVSGKQPIVINRTPRDKVSVSTSAKPKRQVSIAPHVTEHIYEEKSFTSQSPLSAHREGEAQTNADNAENIEQMSANFTSHRKERPPLAKNPEALHVIDDIFTSDNTVKLNKPKQKQKLPLRYDPPDLASIKKTNMVLEARYKNIVARSPKTERLVFRSIEKKVVSAPKKQAKARAGNKPLVKDQFEFQKELRAQALKSMSNINTLIDDTLPGVSVPPWIRKVTWKKQADMWKRILNDSNLEKRIADIKKTRESNMRPSPISIAAKEEAIEQKLAAKHEIENFQKASDYALRDRHNTVVRLTKYMEEVDDETNSYVVRRRNIEERLIKQLIEESIKAQKDCVRELQQYKKQEQKREAEKKLIKAEARRQYLKDQVEMLQDELRKAKEEEKLKEKFFKEEIRQARREQKQALRNRIGAVKQSLRHDGTDFYFREKDVELAVRDNAVKMNTIKL